jgi:transcriptional regulator with XRE-family HTH domain
MPAPDAPSRLAALARLKTALIEKKMTQAELADAADCHEKTIQNLMNGRSVRDQTLFDVSMVLGLDFDEIKSLWSGGARDVGTDAPGKAGGGGEIAPLYMGAYSRAAVDHYVGSYLTLRPAFRTPGNVFAYRTDIVWDADWPSLLFRESQRLDLTFQHQGRLYIPSSSMFIHLVSLTKGAMRVIMVSQLDTSASMRGVITTLNKRGATFLPVAAPIAYIKADAFAADAFGEIGPDHPRHAGYRRLLKDTIDDGYARLIDVP